MLGSVPLLRGVYARKSISLLGSFLGLDMRPAITAVSLGSQEVCPGWGQSVGWKDLILEGFTGLLNDPAPNQLNP